MHALSACLVRRALVASVLMVSTAFTNADMVNPAASGELEAYVTQRDESFRWREIRSGRIGKVEYTEFLLTSQTWRGIEWKHQFYLLRPSGMKADVRSALLFVHGGRWKPEYETETRAAKLPREAPYFARLTEAIGAPVGILRQVPFQPIFERREDALIAYTLDQYLRTGEPDWPVLLPMVKSAVRAMDAMQTIARERWNIALTQFTVAGASKRGWTSWLTAAVDPRVMAAAPMVIDVLNMRAQMDLQRATWGELSDEIRDYASLDLPSRLGSERGAELLSMVDPFSYRAGLTQPKLIMLSTNDRYWPLDALKLYWSELPEPKNVIYVPNQGHGLRDAARVIGALSAVHRYAASNKTLPRTRWSFASTDDALEIRVDADRPVARVLIWSAESATKDFREARWTSRRCRKRNEGHLCTVARGKMQYTAVFAETSFKDQGALLFSTTTTVCIVRRDSKSNEDCRS